MSRSRMTVGVLCAASIAAAHCRSGGASHHGGAALGPVTSIDDPVGVPASALVDDLSVVGSEEVDLVEQVLTHRANYHRTLTMLRDYYRDHGHETKLAWAEFELHGLGAVKPFRYILDAEVPLASLRPEASIADADAVFDAAIALMKKGGYGVPFRHRQNAMLRAARLLRELIERYPDSDKIDDAAFFLGEIHKDFLRGQEVVAVRWFERAWTWDPHTPHPARFEAAVVYDYRLRDRDRALELYQRVVRDETADRSNVRFATRRIHELTTRQHRLSDAGPR